MAVTNHVYDQADVAAATAGLVHTANLLCLDNVRPFSRHYKVGNVEVL